jgi:hypothetical protein
VTAWWIGNQPDPDDRRRIEVSPLDDRKVEDLERDTIVEVIDLLTGETLRLRRISCGAGCACAIGIAP